MSKSLLTLILLGGYCLSYAQLIPSTKGVEKQWIKNEAYKMAWYMVRDTTRMEIGTVSTQLMTDKGRLTVVTAV